jgi:hypothetical protein
MVAFKQDKYFDPDTKKFYSGVYVSTYISKGAQDAWEKVLDGTYSGFSIGGRMNKWDDAYDEKMDKPIRIIKDYDLMELSLVDTPANQFASILSVEKNANNMSNVEIENVFYDKDSGLVLLSKNETEIAPTNGNAMQNIGFVEKSDDDKIDMIKFLVDSAKGINVTKMTQEDNMTEENIEVATEEVVAEAVEIAPEADAEIEAPVAEVEKADKPEAAAEGEMDATESSDDDDEEEKKAEKSDEVSADAVTDLKDAVTSAFSEITAVVKSLADEVAALRKSHELTEAKIADAEKDFSNLGKSVDAVIADTAFRKSGDLGEIVQEPAMVEKSVWGGRFLTTSDLLK